MKSDVARAAIGIHHRRMAFDQPVSAVFRMAGGLSLFQNGLMELEPVVQVVQS